MLYPYPGYCGTVVQILQKSRVQVVQNSQKFFVRYGCCTELTEVPGTGDTRVNTKYTPSGGEFEYTPSGGEFDLKWRI